MSPASTALQARRFAALGDPTRLSVFTLIARSPLSVAEVAEGGEAAGLEGSTRRRHQLANVYGKRILTN